MKSFNKSQFAYCPFEWMCYDKKSDNRKTTYTMHTYEGFQ